MDTTLTSQQPCPFCQKNNLLKAPIIATTEGAYLIPAQGSKENYLIIPTVHAETPHDLPDDWWRSVKQLLPQAPHLTPDYNLSFNIGAHAGQTIKHLHLWVIPRHEGQHSSGQGLARLVHEKDNT